MSRPAYLNPTLRQDFVFLFDIVDGNPNGDPDAGNLPRIDPETMQGLVTDVSLKRRIRNYVDATVGTQERFKIYVQSGTTLNSHHERAYTALGIKSTGTKQSPTDVQRLRDWMCANFYDIRMFGAVMTTALNCGQVRGPVQITFSRSIDPIAPLDIAIVRVAVTRMRNLEGTEKTRDDSGHPTQIGRKAIVPYGLYRGFGFFNAVLARATGVNDRDLDLFWSAFQHMFDLDRSSTRGVMALRGLYVFSHRSALGDMPAHRLFERIRVRLRSEGGIPRKFSDYEVLVDEDPSEALILTRVVG